MQSGFNLIIITSFQTNFTTMWEKWQSKQKQNRKIGELNSHKMLIKITKEGGEMQTLKEVEACTEEFLTPKDVAKVLGCDAQTIRIQANRCPERLGFPVSIIGTRVKIPKEAFLRFMKGDLKPNEQNI